jgi:UDP-hydrolysing UDP-N-acetyl-D-glucosamine 2-epimerase
VSPRKLCVVTGSRAEYGLLFWLIREIADDPGLELQLVVTGMHLAPEFGYTVRLIEQDGFLIAGKVDLLVSGDSPTVISKSIGLGVIGFADHFERLKPDVLVVLGDRFEVFAAAQAAMVARIPIAHISGGEITEGGIDDVIRHGLSKMAYFHFVSAEPYRRRVIQLGEHPSRVMNFGDPGVESVVRAEPMGREELSEALGFELGGPFFLVTYHPETLGDASPDAAVGELLTALDRFPDHRVVVTKANADAGGRSINAAIDRWAERQQERVFVSASLGQRNYSSAMRHCAAVVGNSSSGIVEAPVMSVATVNVGTRQAGRLMAESIVTCGPARSEIEAAIRQVLAPAFQERLPNIKPVYGQGDTARLIKDFLKSEVVIDLTKTFYDLQPATE